GPDPHPQKGEPRRAELEAGRARKGRPDASHPSGSAQKRTSARGVGSGLSGLPLGRPPARFGGLVFARPATMPPVFLIALEGDAGAGARMPADRSSPTVPTHGTKGDAAPTPPQSRRRER